MNPLILLLLGVFVFMRDKKPAGARKPASPTTLAQAQQRKSGR